MNDAAHRLRPSSGILAKGAGRPLGAVGTRPEVR